jgi:hypothetical protein
MFSFVSSDPGGISKGRDLIIHSRKAEKRGTDVQKEAGAMQEAGSLWGLRQAILSYRQRAKRVSKHPQQNCGA